MLNACSHYGDRMSEAQMGANSVVLPGGYFQSSVQSNKPSDEVITPFSGSFYQGQPMAGESGTSSSDPFDVRASTGGGGLVATSDSDKSQLRYATRVRDPF